MAGSTGLESATSGLTVSTRSDTPTQTRRQDAGSGHEGVGGFRRVSAAVSGEFSGERRAGVASPHVTRKRVTTPRGHHDRRAAPWPVAPLPGDRRTSGSQRGGSTWPGRRPYAPDLRQGPPPSRGALAGGPRGSSLTPQTRQPSATT